MVYIPKCTTLTNQKPSIFRLYKFCVCFQLDSQASGYVDWNEFCTYLLLLYRENDYMRTKREIPFLEEPKIRHIVQNRVGDFNSSLLASAENLCKQFGTLIVF